MPLSLTIDQTILIINDTQNDANQTHSRTDTEHTKYSEIFLNNTQYSSIQNNKTQLKETYYQHKPQKWRVLSFMVSWVSLSRMLLCWISLGWVSLGRMLLGWVSLSRMSLGRLLLWKTLLGLVWIGRLLIGRVSLGWMSRHLKICSKTNSSFFAFFAIYVAILLKHPFNLTLTSLLSLSLSLLSHTLTL